MLRLQILKQSMQDMDGGGVHNDCYHYIATLTCAMLTAPSLPKGLPSGILLDVLWDREKGERYF